MKWLPGITQESRETSISTAKDIVRQAADASRSKRAPIIRIVGRADLAEAVKAALVLQGARPTSIALVGRDDASPVVCASDRHGGARQPELPDRVPSAPD